MKKKATRRLPANLRMARELLGISQSKLAEAAGVTQPVISKIEAGINDDPKTSTTYRLALALNVTVEDLLEG